jgi:tRNA(Ile2)-agmatinylcytidine synthase
MSRGAGGSELVHIAFDDTDSRLGRCTTHLAFKITGHLRAMGAELVDYPLLIRLNPNIPWKTRGNGAVCIRARTKDPDKVVNFVRQSVEEGSAIGAGANPAVAFLCGKIPPSLAKFSSIAMFDVLSRQKAEKVAKENSIEYFTFGNGQGLVGALGAMGCLLESGDYTFELISYRRPENCGTPRFVDRNRVIECHGAFPDTFNSYDEKNKRVLIAPHGPDPVFCGIRGEDPDPILSAFSMLQPEERLDGYMVFRSNQGTNMHLQNPLKLNESKVYTAGYVRCRVKEKPQAMQGGHVLFAVEDDSGSMLAAVYEPTGLGRIAASLDAGDIIEIGCGVRKPTVKHPKVLNVEYIRILELACIFDILNPVCKICGKRMKSEGKNKGFQCDKCKYRDITATKVYLPKRRNIEPGLYLPVPKAHRHLTKPLQRYGKEKSGYRFSGLCRDWFGSADN